MYQLRVKLSLARRELFTEIIALPLAHAAHWALAAPVLVLTAGLVVLAFVESRKPRDSDSEDA
jgi:hypothetical protein